MFGNILGRKKEEISSQDRANLEIEAKISKMNLTDMRAYCRGASTWPPRSVNTWPVAS